MDNAFIVQKFKFSQSLKYWDYNSSKKEKPLQKAQKGTFTAMKPKENTFQNGMLGNSWQQIHEKFKYPFWGKTVLSLKQSICPFVIAFLL